VLFTVLLSIVNPYQPPDLIVSKATVLQELRLPQALTAILGHSAAEALCPHPGTMGVPLGRTVVNIVIDQFPLYTPYPECLSDPQWAIAHLNPLAYIAFRASGITLEPLRGQRFKYLTDDPLTYSAGRKLTCKLEASMLASC
jgi:hypothetical protein